MLSINTFDFTSAKFRKIIVVNLIETVVFLLINHTLYNLKWERRVNATSVVTISYRVRSFVTNSISVSSSNSNCIVLTIKTFFYTKDF